MPRTLISIPDLLAYLSPTVPARLIDLAYDLGVTVDIVRRAVRRQTALQFVPDDDAVVVRPGEWERVRAIAEAHAN